MRSIVSCVLLVALLGGCVAGNENKQDPATDDPLTADAPRLVSDLINRSIAQLPAMTFSKQVVTAAIAFGNDLYEPTMEVSGTGVVYITGHTIGADTTGAPVFASDDDGKTWRQLPFFQALVAPEPLHGATPPPSDEIFLAAGDDGWLYGVDITLATYPVNAWSNDGTVHAYHNPNAYDESQNGAQAREDCTPLPAKDRPWGAYANGTLLLVSNPGGGPAQVGVMQVPPALGLGYGTAPDGIEWNLCAGPGGSIPGVPDIRGDGLFAVPQLSGGFLNLVLGNKADVMATQITPVFKVRSAGEITSFYGHAVFDTPGTLFAGITNNTYHRETRNGTNPLGLPTTSLVTVPDDGQLIFAVSVDDGATFVNRTYTMPGQPMRHFYMDANENGAGALVVWAVDGETRNSDNETTAWDWYVGHLQLGADGAPEMISVHLAINEGPQPSAHVTGAAVGPDGRAYIAMYESVPRGGTPLSVYVQGLGPTLPVG